MNDDVLDKIRKCLALSKSANENEAAIAFKQAQALMKKYKLTGLDVEFSDIKQHSIKTDLKRLRVLETRLAKMVAEVFECGFLIKKNRDFIFYGTEPNIHIADYAYHAVLPILKKSRKEYVAGLHGNTSLKTKRALGHAFCMGWVASVRRKCANLNPDQDLKERLNKYSDQILKPKTIEINQGKLSANAEQRAIAQGFEQGDKVELFASIKGSHEQLKLR